MLQKSPESMIETVIAAATPELEDLGWKLDRTELRCRGMASFVREDGSELIFEIGSWYPPGAHPLEDQPAILLYFKSHESIRVLVPLSDPGQISRLTWSSSPEEVQQGTLEIIRDFNSSFLSKHLHPAVLFNAVLDRSIQSRGILDQELLNNLQVAFAYDAATTVEWARRKVSLFRERLLSGLEILVFEPANKTLKRLSTPAEFDQYLASNVYPLDEKEAP